MSHDSFNEILNHNSASIDQLQLLENKMRTATSDLSFELHQDFKLLYSIMNGQDFTQPIRRLDGLFNATPLFGYIQVYDLILLSYFVSIELILQFIDRPRIYKGFSNHHMIFIILIEDKQEELTKI